MTEPSLKLRNVSLVTPTGRTLFDGLNLSLSDEHVALVGRNGVGKSTLLSVVAGLTSPTSGSVRVGSRSHYVPQALGVSELRSQGELRRLALGEARDSGADLLLLDEPTLDLDDAAVAWLKGWLHAWRGPVIVASHDRRLLADVRHFFVVSEGGCHYVNGTLDDLARHLEREHRAEEQRYVRNLNRLADAEAHTDRVARRRARKKRRGRSRELDRATPRIRLNQKRDHAQVSHGRLAALHEARLSALRGWTQATRRALAVSLELELPVPDVPPDTGRPAATLRGVSATGGGRLLFHDLDLELGRQRLAVIGPNGAGKTTLLQTILGQRGPSTGSVQVDLSRIGWIAQGGRNWLVDASLHEELRSLGVARDEVARILIAHKFPLALAERPLKSLSPGERARAALIALFARSPPVELLVLDEPTYSLDLVGLRAITRALTSWRGGLVVASHDRKFLDELGMERTLSL